MTTSELLNLAHKI